MHQNVNCGWGGALEPVGEAPIELQNSQKLCYFDASQLKKYTCYSNQIAHK